VKVSTFVFSTIVLASISMAGLGQAESRPILRLSQSIELPNVQGGFDHLAYDSVGKRVFVAAEDNGSIEVIDLQKAVRIASIPGFQSPHSILVRPGSSTILVTDSGPEASAFVSSVTLMKTRQLKLALGANCILFDAQRKRLYVTAGGDRVHLSSSILQSINPDTGEIVKSVTVNALHLQPMALDLATNRLFVNLADQHAVGIFNAESLQRISTWKIPGCKKNSPIIFDGEHHRLFVVCGDPGVLLVLDSDSGSVETSIPTPSDPDDMDLDASTNRLFIPGDGSLNVYDVSRSSHVKLIQRVATAKDAKTGLLLPGGRRYLLAVPSSKKAGKARIDVFDAH
jgi:DNA-binding beta-propeller fold protein YncE